MTKMFNSWSMLGRYGRPSELPGERNFNPRPPGVPVQGSATEVVLGFLRENPERWFTHQEIMHRVQRTKPAVDWALIRLRS